MCSKAIYFKYLSKVITATLGIYKRPCHTDSVTTSSIKLHQWFGKESQWVRLDPFQQLSPVFHIQYYPRITAVYSTLGALSIMRCIEPSIINLKFPAAATTMQ